MKLTIDTSNWKLIDINNFYLLYDCEFDCENEEIIIMEVYKTNKRNEELVW